MGSTLWDTSTNFTELTDAVGLVATCDYPSDKPDLSGEGTMKIVSFNLTHDGARTLVKPLKAREKTNITGCHYKVDDVDEVTHAWRCSENKHATLATNAFTPGRVQPQDNHLPQIQRRANAAVRGGWRRRRRSRGCAIRGARISTSSTDFWTSTETRPGE